MVILNDESGNSGPSSNEEERNVFDQILETNERKRLYLHKINKILL